MKIRHLLIAGLVFLLANAASPVAAGTPQGRHVTGTVEKADAPAQEVALLRDDEGTLVSFVWNSRTTFATHSKITDASIIKKGVRIEVSLHKPFFGKPFVTKVTLLPPANPTAKSK